ncbi:Agmatine deiminase [Rubripirellula tenax]|uniref:Agmatine deiminase n=1 Tax=Rubripirellula tenax TaxID=2528015 RepID=A0A5C6E6P8_9BACT|nr:agmatine deiminase family protein [Rubripirellula tenax]TWU43637.1 Agmatine deiminase [Rubripirellula tenax]
MPTPLHLEGGTVLSNGKGLTLLSSNVIDSNRGYGFDDRAIDREMRRITGAKTLATFQPLIGEKTGHIDLFMTFTDERTVVVGEYRDTQNPNHRLLNEHAKTLSQLSGAEKLRVVRIPMPEQMGQVFRTYTNVIYANGVLLVPSFSDTMDAEALEIFQNLLPNWRIEFIDCSEISTKGGALHCLVSNLGNTPYTPMPIRIRAKATDHRHHRPDRAE